MNLDLKKEKEAEFNDTEKEQSVWESVLSLTKKIHTCIIIVITFAGISSVDSENQFVEKHKTDKRHHVKIVRDKKKGRNT